jgi:hypothetical protein
MVFLKELHVGYEHLEADFIRPFFVISERHSIINQSEMISRVSRFHFRHCKRTHYFRL